MQNFNVSDANRLSGLFVSKGMLSEEAGTVAHALLDIRESMERIYGELLPAILNGPEVEKSVLEEHLWEIHEEFRHVDYHIHDAGFAHAHFDGTI